MERGGVVRHIRRLARDHCLIFSQCDEALLDTLFMKRPSVKPSDENMKFFSRSLYAQFNSSDPTLADEADEQWELAVAEYKRHLRQLSKVLPESAKKLSKICLHDAELINQKKMDPFLVRLPNVAFVGVVQRVNDDTWLAYLIWYSLFDAIHTTSVPVYTPFSKSNVHWLYDEVDWSEAGKNRFIHRILLSDGRVIVIPFTNVGIHELKVHAESLAGMVVQSA
jgi:hypothetical protein